MSPIPIGIQILPQSLIVENPRGELYIGYFSFNFVIPGMERLWGRFELAHQQTPNYLEERMTFETSMSHLDAHSVWFNALSPKSWTDRKLYLLLKEKANDITLSSVTFKSRIYINHGQLNCVGQFEINNLQGHKNKKQRDCKEILIITRMNTIQLVPFERMHAYGSN